MSHRTYIYAIFLPRIELFYIEEWARHHFKLGIQRIYLYHNGFSPVDDSKLGNSHPHKLKSENSTKWSKKPLEDYNLDLSDEEIDEKLEQIEDKFNGKLHIKHWHTSKAGTYPGSQFRGYRDMRKNIINFQKITRKPHNLPLRWLIIDIDEFLVLHKDKNIQSFIERKQEYGAIRIVSRIFQSRTNKKPVRSIFNWGYDSDVCKTIVINRGTPRIKAHCTISRINRTTTAAQRSEAEIFHYRGAPWSGTQIKKGFGDEQLLKEMEKPNPSEEVFKKIEEIFSKQDFTMKKYMYD